MTQEVVDCACLLVRTEDEDGCSQYYVRQECSYHAGLRQQRDELKEALLSVLSAGSLVGADQNDADAHWETAVSEARQALANAGKEE